MLISNAGADVARNAGWKLAQGFYTNIAAIWIFFLAAWLLPTIEDLGVYYALTMIATLFYILMGFGLPKANLRFVAWYVGQNRKADAAAVAKLILKLGPLFSTSGSILLWLFSGTISNLLNMSSSTWALEAIVPYVFLLILQPFIESAIAGLQRFDTVARIQVFQSTVSIITGSVLLFSGYGILGIIICWTSGSLCGNLLSLHFFRNVFNHSDGKAALKPLLSFSAPLYGMDLASYLVQNTDKFVILLLTGVAVLGIYSPAVTIATFVSLVGTSLFLVLLPKMSEVEGRFGSSGLALATKESSRWAFLIMTPMSFGLAAISIPLTRVFGDRFLPSVPFIVIISLTMALTAGYVVVNGALIALGRTSIFLTSAVVGILVNIVVSVALIPSIGIMGVAFGRAGLQFCVFLLPLVYMKQNTGQVLDYSSMLSTLLASIIMIAPLVLIQLFTTEVIILPLLIAVGFLTYLISIRHAGILNEGDVEIFRQFLPRKMGFVVLMVSWLARGSSRERTPKEQNAG